MSTIAPADGTLAALDDAKPGRLQRKILFIAGMGFFTDAYDLFVIGIAVSILKTQWHLSTTQVSLLSSTTLAASAVGALLFGRLADILGRKRMYGYEVLILAVGAIASAFSPSIAWLIVFRIVLGIGIGGDYPVSATIMSEYAGKRTRGRMVGLVFAMQAAGLIVGPLLAVLMLSAGLSHELTWRLLLGVGAIPGIAVFYLRRRISETPRFRLAAARAEASAPHASASHTSAPHASAPPTLAPDGPVPHRQTLAQGWIKLLTQRTLLKWLIGSSVAWFVMDFAYYGNTIASPEIIKLLSPTAGLVHTALLTLLIFVLAATPGYVLAIAFIDRIGRKRIQTLGFLMMALMFGLIAAIPGVATTAAPFVVLFGISYFFTEFGPNTTTFVYPAEIFPTDVRTSGHGIAAALGKLGGFAGTYLFPQMLASWGIRGAEGVAAGVAMLGLVVTLALLPEPKGRSLEEIAAHTQAPAAPSPLPLPAAA